MNRKMLTVFAIGQFLLAAGLLYSLIEFRRSSAESRELEEQLSGNCRSVRAAVDAVNQSKRQSDEVIRTVSAALPTLGTEIKRCGMMVDKLSRFVRGVSREPFDEAGEALIRSGGVLREYSANTAPRISEALTETSETLDRVAVTLDEQKPYSSASWIILAVGFCLLGTTVLNAAAMWFTAREIGSEDRRRR